MSINFGLKKKILVGTIAITGTNDALLKGTMKNTRLFFGDVLTTEEIVNELVSGPT